MALLAEGEPMAGTVRPGRRRLRRSLIIARTVGAVLIAAVVSDVVLVGHRIDHVRVHFPRATAGDVWVIVGSDNRAETPSGPNVFGTTAQVQGQRADIVLVLKRDGASTTLLSVPRDLLVATSGSTINRLALTFADGPQRLVDSLCSGLGIPAQHLVVVSMAAFAYVVDRLGGVTVTIDQPMRDAWSGLDLKTAGTQKLTGVQALALVRSRRAEVYDGRTWVATAPLQGAQERARWASTVFGLVTAKLADHRWNPVVMQGIAWSASPHVTVDSRTGLTELLRLAHQPSGVVSLPAKAVTGSELALVPDASTFDTLRAAGFSRDCS